ncbi:hypothetical protein D3C81_1181520 [compost metagenome]
MKDLRINIFLDDAPMDYMYPDLLILLAIPRREITYVVLAIKAELQGDNGQVRSIIRA